MPESAVRGSIRTCIDQFRIAADLAELAVDGPAPEDGAEHIVGVVDELSAEILTLRAAVQAAYSVPR